MHTPKCHCLVDPCPPPDSWKIIYCPLHDAAPDLLAALKKCLDHLRTTNDLYLIVRDAIRKAEGR